MPDHESYVITIRDAANRHETRPISIRLRTLLKLMLRGFGLRCVDIRSTNPSHDSTNKSAAEMNVLE